MENTSLIRFDILNWSVTVASNLVYASIIEDQMGHSWSKLVISQVEFEQFQCTGLCV